jgi:ribosomal protein S18 acetylase RimI-like enzyme
MHLEIRLFKDEDLSELIEMMLALYREDPPGRPMNQTKVKATVQELRNHPEKGRIWIIEADQQVAGYALMIDFWSNEWGGDVGHIDELYVKAPFRRQGIGSQFLRFLPRQVPGLKALGLEVTPANESAKKLYVREGFVVSQNTHLIKELTHKPTR